MKTHEQYESELFEKQIDYWPLEEYTRAHDKILHECLNGHKWYAQPVNILRGRGCPECLRKFTKKKNTEQHVADLHKLNKHFSLVDGETYINNKTPLNYTCTKGHISSLRPDLVLRGYGCVKCNNRGRYSKGYFERFPDQKSAVATLYIVELYNTIPICIKVGVTTDVNLCGRLSKIPFKTKLLHKISSTLENAYEIEQDILRDFIDYKYTSSKVFDGHRELLSLNCKELLGNYIREVRL